MLVRDILPDIKQALGTNSDSAAFVALNRAVDLLANAGSWMALERFADIPLIAGQTEIVLPACVDTPLSLAINGTPKEFQSQWVETVVDGPGPSRGVPGHNWRDGGTSPVLASFKGDARLVAVSESVQDDCAEVLVFGTDPTGKTLRSQRENGTWVDGLILPASPLKDFGYGLVRAPENLPVTRQFTVTAPTVFSLRAGYENPFKTGASVVVEVVSGTLELSPFLERYCARVLAGGTISLHPSQLDAQEGTNPVSVAAWSLDADVRISLTLDLVPLTFFRASKLSGLVAGDAVSLTGIPPAGFDTETTYYANPLDTKDFRLHSSVVDALAGVNPLLPCSEGETFSFGEQHDILPETQLLLASPSRFQTGDAVFLDGGNYGVPPTGYPSGTVVFFRRVSPTLATLHKTQSEAASGAYPFVATSGTGGRVYRVLDGAAVLSTDTITTNTPHRLSSGQEVLFDTTGSLPAPLVVGNPYFVRNVLGPNNFTLASAVQTPVASGTATLTSTGTAAYDPIAVSWVEDPVGQFTASVDEGEDLDLGEQIFLTSTSGAPPTGFNVGTLGLGPYYFVVSSATDAPNFSLSTTEGGAPYSGSGTFSGTQFVTRRVSKFNLSLPSQFIVGQEVKVTAGVMPEGLSPSVSYFVINVSGRLTLALTPSGTEIKPTSEGSGVTVATVATQNTPVDLITQGSGVLKVVSSSSFDLSFTGAFWVDDTTTLTASDTVRLGTEGLLPPTAPTTNPGVDYYVAPVASDRVRLYANSGLTVAIVPEGFGGGRSYLKEDIGVTVIRDGSQVVLSSTEGLDDTLLETRASGVFVSDNPPGGLVSNTLYEWRPGVEGFRAPYVGGIPLTISSVGVCPHGVEFSARLAIPSASASINVPHHEFRPGDAVRILPPCDGLLPAGLEANHCYYVRPFDSACDGCAPSGLLLFESEANSVVEGCYTGITRPSSAGSGTHRLQFLRPNPWVRRIEDIRKEVTKGVLTLLAEAPANPIPQVTLTRLPASARNQYYRKIKIASGGCWARLHFRRSRDPHLSAEEPLLFKNQLALILAVKAVKSYMDDFYELGDAQLARAVELLAQQQLRGRSTPNINFTVNRRFSPGGFRPMR